MPIADAVEIGDVFITVTGNKHVIRTEHINRMKDGVILANSGHFDVEIDIAGLKHISVKTTRIRPFLDEYILQGGKKIYVCGEGRLVNLAAAEGHPSTVMSLSFCGQALACEYLVKNSRKIPIKVITLPDEIDNEIASLQLEAMDIKKDSLTNEQRKYLEIWVEGT